MWCRQFSKKYVPQEDTAKAAQLGLWAGAFVYPWEWRKQGNKGGPGAFKAGSSWGAPPNGTSSGSGGSGASSSGSSGGSSGAQEGGSGGGECDIKGIINSSGDRICHLPGSPSYEATWIDPAKGERWFCSVAEAQAAGWRCSSAGAGAAPGFAVLLAGAAACLLMLFVM